MSDGKRLAKTLPIPGSPGTPQFEEPEPVTVRRMPESVAPATEAMAPPAHDPIPEPQVLQQHGFEIQIFHERPTPGDDRHPWRAAEIWTKHHVYGLDSNLVCFEVLDRRTGQLRTQHPMIGARLGGGRVRGADEASFSYPYPLASMEAMFMQAKKHGYTSAVERVVLRMRVLHTRAEDAAPSWDELALRGRSLDGAR